jgi:hypothetical protein
MISSGNVQLKRRSIVLSIALFAIAMLTTGCLHREVVTPQLVARHCPKDSLPFQAVYHGVLMNHGELCMAINPVTNQPMGLFPVQAYNPYTETDMDMDDGDKKVAKAAWWEFWRRKRERERD